LNVTKSLGIKARVTIKTGRRIKVGVTIETDEM
jgi:hypothetical protein